MAGTGQGCRPCGSPRSADQRVFSAPLASLKETAAKAGLEVASAAFAAHMDAQDPLAKLRDEFHIPTLGSLSADAPGALAQAGAAVRGADPSA